MRRPGLIIVRSDVDARSIDEFDQWYADEHLGQVVEELGARRARRFRAHDGGPIHVAIYEFDDIDTCMQLLESGALTTLVTAYDQRWAERATRIRDVLVEVDDHVA